MKKLLLILLALTMCVSLCACGGEKLTDEILNSRDWYSEYTYKGNSFRVGIAFFDSGTYSGTYYQTIEKNGELIEQNRGTYTIDGNKVYCDDFADNSRTTYTYKNGTLENNGHIFS